MHILKRTAELVSTSNVKMRGLYEIKKYKAGDNSLVQHILPFENIITDWGLNWVATANPFLRMFVGTGTAAGATTDTQMGNYLGVSLLNGAITRVAGTSPAWVYTASVTARFNPPSAAGNLTEVGIGIEGAGPVNITHRVWSRALIVDGAGNPITLTVLPDEYLDVTYILQFHPQITEDSYNISVSGTTHAVTSRRAYITEFGGYFGIAHFSGTATAYGGPVTLGAITTGLSGATASAEMGGWVNATYTDNSLKHVSTVTCGISNGNVPGGITGILSGTGLGSPFVSQYTQFTITPAIDKTDSKILTLGREVSWARY